jgi:hypothetical protein
MLHTEFGGVDSRFDALDGVEGLAAYGAPKPH